ncbi:MAG: DNA polymerase III subunit delta [Candidatus Paceibacterota bacterium]|jgi:DNA polymerase III delta subunit
MIVFLYGKDNFRSYQKLREIVEKYQEKFPESLSFKSFNAAKLDFNEFKVTTQVSALFSEKKLIVLHATFSLKAELQKKLIELFKEKHLDKDENNIIIFWEQGEADKRTSLFKYLEKYSKSQNFGLLNKHQTEIWINKIVDSQFPDLKIHSSAITFLSENLGSNLWRIYNELVKIHNYFNGSNKVLITKRDVLELVNFPTEADIFKTIDALAFKQKKQALKALAGHFKNLEPELKILAMFEYQFRGLIRIRSLIEEGRDYQFIQRETKIHPYAFRKMYGLAKNFSMKELEKIYDRLFDLDIGFKTGYIQNKQIALEMFIIEVCQ